MKFRFCGEGDCPDWILAEINTLSRLSSIKLKALTHIVSQGVLKPPVDMIKAEKLFSDSKLDSNIDLKACIACLSFIISSTIRFNCNSTALHSELQQLGLPREHSTSIKRVVDDQYDELTSHFNQQSLKVNNLEEVSTEYDPKTNCICLDLQINGTREKIALIPHTADVLLKELKEIRDKMVQLNDSPLAFL